MSSSIPPEILTDIFVRLPVKPLLRFRSVSKPWCALIDSPYFIKRHLKRSNRSLYLGGNGYLYSLDYNALGTPIKLKVPVKESFGFDIIGSCNGLLLLEKNATHRKYVSLLNPATRQYRVIPDTQTDYPSDPVVITFEKFGFGYDSVHDDYKVIRVVEFEGRDYSWIGSEARIYSLKTNCWHKVDTFPYCLPYKMVWVHLDGRLHSFVNATFLYGKDDVNTTSDANPPRIIVSFDLATEKCDYIALPNGLDDSYFEITVEVYDGMLCVQASYEGHRIDIWVMREYGVNESWFKFLSISPPFVDPHATIHPLALSSNGGEVLLCCNDESVLWYDHERKTIKRSPFHGTFPFYVEVCVDSLVPLESAGKSGSVKEVKSKEVKELRIQKPKKVNEEKPKEKKNKKSDGFLSTGFKLKL